MTATTTHDRPVTTAPALLFITCCPYGLGEEEGKKKHQKSAAPCVMATSSALNGEVVLLERILSLEKIRKLRVTA
jgi:hypothetical protein